MNALKACDIREVYERVPIRRVGFLKSFEIALKERDPPLKTFTNKMVADLWTATPQAFSGLIYVKKIGFFLPNLLNTKRVLVGRDDRANTLLSLF